MSSIKKRVQLPIKIPCITSLPNIASATSVLYTDNEALPYIYNNFVNIYIETCENNLLRFNYASTINAHFYEFMKRIMSVQIFERETQNLFGGSIIDFLINILNHGYYAFFTVCQFYVPYTQAYNLLPNFMHPIFVFGYDIENKTFDFCEFIQGKYTPKKLTFLQLEQAYNNYEGEFSRIWIYKITDGIKEPFNIEIFKLGLEDFLDSREWIKRYNYCLPSLVGSGISAYEHIIDDMKKRIDSYCYIDIRLFGILLDHKNFTLERLYFLIENNYISEHSQILSLYSQIRNCVSTMSSLALKYNFKLNSKVKSNQEINKIIMHMQDLLDKERMATELLLKELNNKSF